MKNRSKAIVLFICTLALVVSGVFSTLAYLTSTDKVENTFTVGNVEITLDEADVDEYGEPIEDAARVKANEYKLLPGHTYTKDPTIHVDANSEDCWLFVKVVDEIAAIEDTTTVAEQMTAKGWSLVSGTTNIYAYKEIVKGSNDVVVFENFKIKGDVTNETLATYAGKTIVVTAYAVQADGFTTAAEAWTAAGLN